MEDINRIVCERIVEIMKVVFELGHDIRNKNKK